MSIHIFPSKMKNRRYVLGNDITVCCLNDHITGTLKAGSLVRIDPRKNNQFKLILEASTDNGKNWYKCTTNDTFSLFRSSKSH